MVTGQLSRQLAELETPKYRIIGLGLGQENFAVYCKNPLGIYIDHDDV